MDDDLRGYEDEPGWIASAAHHAPVAGPASRPPPPVPAGVEARRAVWVGVLALLCFGVVLGPVALAMGHRARMALAFESRVEGVSAAHAAITLGKAALALHLALLATIVPWLLFALPLLRSRGY